MKIKFEQFFESSVLERGHEYYLKGKVRGVEVSSDKIKAFVYGRSIYHVVIDLVDGDIHNLSCDCPYTWGNGCKHEAAVLYAVEAGDYEQIKKVEPSDSIAVLQQISKEELIQYLATHLESDHSFRLDFTAHFGAYFSASSSDFLNEWYDIRYRNSDRHGFIDYSNTRDFSIDMKDLSEKMSKAAKHHPKAVFDALTEIYYGLIDLPIDDSNGTTGEIATELQGVMMDCFQYEDAEFMEEIQAWVLKAIDDEDLENYCLDEGLDEVYLKTMPINEQITYLENNTYCSYDIQKLLTLYKMENVEEKRIYAHMIQNDSLTTAIDWLFDYYMQHNQPERAIELLLLNKETQEYQLQLIQLYDEFGYHTEYDKEMRCYLAGHHSRIVSQYQAYKKKFQPKVWENECLELIRSMQSVYNRLACYALEDKEDCLMTEIEQSDIPVNYIYEYEHILSPTYDAKLIQIYRKDAESNYSVANNTNYDQIATDIHHIIGLSGGEEVAKDMVRELKATYKARRNLMKLLKEFPFFEAC